MCVKMNVKKEWYNKDRGNCMGNEDIRLIIKNRKEQIRISSNACQKGTMEGYRNGNIPMEMKKQLGWIQEPYAEEIKKGKHMKKKCNKGYNQGNVLEYGRRIFKME